MRSKNSGDKFAAFVYFLLGAISVFYFFRITTCVTSSEYTVKKTSNGIWLLLAPNDYVCNHIKRDKLWEECETKYLLDNVKKGDVVIEVGAHVGYYTTLLAKLVGKEGRVYSYEANDEVFKLAQLSLNMNALSDVVVLKNIGITNKSGDGLFSFVPLNFSTRDEINSGHSHIYIGGKDRNYFRQKRIKMTSLDEDLPDVKNVDMLRMDIEGSEILALRGAKNIIKNSPNLKIVMEWQPNTLGNYGDVSNLVDEMHSYGFKFYFINDYHKDNSLKKEAIKRDLLNLNGDVVLIRN